ncbi:AAA family ATPase [Tissierella sp.]|uniref:AAA family ATPase n=1 Tax=Tissierella sp. TaxID=41274 RepID=UPI00285BAAC2|nr:AAA family ATPase [Tissierella sp.]MDR7857850.1 AAA family ATPase [Tissierella sp.]
MFLLQMAGFPGSGKSTMAQLIAKHTNSIVIDRDVIKSPMLNAGIKDQLLADASYLVTFDLAAYYLSKGISVIIDTPCYYQETVDKGLELCKEYNSVYKYIECKVDSYDEIERRISTRKNLPTQISQTTRDRFNNSLDKSVKPIDTDTIVVNSTLDKNYNIDIILNYINKK